MMEQFILFATPIFKTISILILIVAYLVWLERKVAAKMQSRIGPYLVGKPHGWLQPLADALKLMLKDDSKPKNSDSLLFNFGPIWIMVVSLASFALLPFYFNNQMINTDLSLMLFIAISSLVIVGIFVAGWSSNNKWALYGGMRSAAQIISYEIPAGISLVTVIMLASSLSMQEIISYQSGGLFNWIIFDNPFVPIAFVVYFISAIAETNRTPFDLPESESELVAGFATEYSGMRYAFFFLSEYANMFVVSAVAAAGFLGGWHSPIQGFMDSPAWGVFWMINKTGFLIFVMIWLRWTLPRLRVDQLMNVCWKVFLPLALINIFGVAIWTVVFNS